MAVGSLEQGGRVSGTRPVDHRDPPAMIAKRAMDILIAAVVLLVLAPVLVAVAVAILVLDGRPILYRQRRVGQFGRLFTIYKFRTMVPDAHQRIGEVAHANERRGPLFKASDDPRVTTVGRFLRRSSIDELPQLLNVLNGTMSLVGPRPALPEERAQFPHDLLEREQVPQGLSGLWQLEGRHSSDFGVYRELDLEYVRTWSLRRDLAIVVRTPFVVLTHALRRPAGSPDPAAEIRADAPALELREGAVAAEEQARQPASPAPAMSSVLLRRSPAAAMSMSSLDD